MKKIIVITSIGLFFFFFGCGKRWTVEGAKQEAFSRVPAQFDISKYPKQDPNFKENQEALKKGEQIVDNRFVTDSPGPPVGYIVSDMIGKGIADMTTFYYPDGRALSIRVFSGPKLPRAAYIYCLDICDSGKGEIYQTGELVSVAWHVSDREVFYFSPKGKLNGHLRD